MARPKPIGFDNYRTFSFVANDGSGFTFFRKASFSIEGDGLHRLYAGASIAAVAGGAPSTVTTAEPHGLHNGQTVVIHGMPAGLALLNKSHVISGVSSTGFSVVGDAAMAGLSCTDVGIVGTDIEARIPVANYAIVPGELCVGDHPEAWEMPLVG